MIRYILLVLIAFAIYSTLRVIFRKRKWLEPTERFPEKWKNILIENVSFYNSLTPKEKKQFEYDIQFFLLNYRITGIKVKIDIIDKLLLASSAVIPIFEFPEWKYKTLNEVLIYPDKFNTKFNIAEGDSNILGQVGSGYMEGIMILSKPALHDGFNNETDKHNTAIHEFIHLIDKSDGVIDGVPELLLQRQYAIPWFQLINKEIENIYKNKSDINPYGGTNRSEFFAVASEYFFERPELFSENHPELYSIMLKIFHKNKNFGIRKTKIKNSSPCPCGSTKSFKECCGQGHFQ